MKNRRKQREMRTHAPLWVLLTILIALCFVTYGGVKGAWGIVNSWIEDEPLPSIEDTEAFNYAQESLMYAGDDTTVLAEFQLEKRNPVTAEQVSPYVLEGTIDTEDVRFYEHNGVDPTGIVRALVNNLRGGSLEGASTITQQLVRNTVLSQEANEISLKRKVREAQLAIDFEKMYSKDEVLIMYLNTINYGDGCYGIEAAAQNYFQVASIDLTLAQAATLVGIPQSPTYLNPKENPEACLTRRNVVLDRMLTAGDITQEEHDAAKAEELILNPAPDAPNQGIYAYPYFTSYVRSLLLAENNPFNVSQADLFEGGLTISTTLDTTLQDKAEAACADQYARMADNLEASIVATDPTTGYIKAMVGGKDYFADQWNIATQGGRPTGSSFKAFTLATAIEQGINPSTLIDCTSPMMRADGVPLENFGGINYGIRSIASATAVSSNTGYYRLVERVTPNATAEMAHRLGVTSPLPNYPNITLGTENTTTLEMANAYATFASGGIKHDPVAITKIVDRTGEVIYEARDTSTRVLTPEVAGAVTKTLRTVFETSGATAYGSGPSNGQPVAGKTGTGMEFRDHWLVGYAPTLSCAAWIGDRYYESTDANLTANALWQDFMSRALDGQAVQPFPETAAPPYGNAFNEEQKKALGPTEEEKKKAEEAATKAKAEADAKEAAANPINAPSVVGMTISQATAALAGFPAEMVEETSSTVPAGTVISQEVVGGKVRLHVSKGPPPAAVR